MAWPQLCFYPEQDTMQLIWEESPAGERLQAVFQEGMGLRDYPFDRQLLSLRALPAWGRHAVVKPIPETV